MSEGGVMVSFGDLKKIISELNPENIVQFEGSIGSMTLSAEKSLVSGYNTLEMKIVFENNKSSEAGT
jgi:hypothetical protein